LAFTSIMLLATINTAFNQIWRVEKERPILWRFLVYWTIISMGPILFVRADHDETFGVAPLPLIPYLAAEHVGLDGRQVDALRAVEPSTLTGTAEADPRADVPRLPLVPVYESEVEEEEEMVE
jgi:hypothetical protein